MYSLTSGGSNVGVGNGSLYTNVTGSYNTAVGVSAISGGVGSHSNNTGVGYFALRYITSGDNNVAVGSNASSVMHGESNVSVGKDALKGASFTDATCDWNAGGSADATVSHNANANIVAGLGVTGNLIPAGSYIASITDTTHFELNQVTSAGSAQVNQTLTFYSRSVGQVAIGYDALTALTIGARS